MGSVSKWLVCGVAGLAFASAASAATYDASTGYVTLNAEGSGVTGAETPFNAAAGSKGAFWSDTLAPHPETNYYVAAGLNIAEPSVKSDYKWQGGKLVVAGYLWMVANTKVITIDDLVMLGSSRSFYCAGTPGPLAGKMTVSGTDPVVFYHNSNGAVDLRLKVVGAADATYRHDMRFTDGKATFSGDWSEFYGSFVLSRSSKTKGEDNPGTKTAGTNGYHLAMSTELGGQLKVEAETRLTLDVDQTVGALELDGGVELVFGDKVNSKTAPGCLTVTGDITLNGKPRIAVGSIDAAFDTADYSYPLIRFKDKEGQELTLDDFEIVAPVLNATFGTFKLKWEIGDSVALAGYRELRIVKAGPVGDLVWYNQEAVAVTKEPNSPFVDQKDSKGTFFWEDEGTPVSGKSYVITNRTTYMRGPSSQSPCQFLGEELYLLGVSLQASSSTASAGGFTAKCMYWNGVTVQIWANQGKADKTIDNSVSWFPFDGGRIYVPEGTTVKNSSYNSQGVKFASEIIGGGTFNLSVASASASTGRRSSNLFCAQNTNFTGRICVTALADYEKDGVRAPTDENCVSLFVTNGLSLGGKCPSFTYDALTLERYGRLRVEACDVELADGLNRGVYINGIGRMTVKEGLALTVNRPITVNGTFRKQGAGTLALGGTMRFTNGAAETLPAEGKNVVRIEEGVLRLDAAHALDGAAIAFAAGTKLVLRESAADDELAAKGLVNVKGDYAGIVSEATDGKIAVEIDGSALAPANEATFALATVATEEAANALAAKLAPSRRMTMGGQTLSRTAVSVASTDGGATWTVSAKYEKTGLAILVR